MHFSQKEIVNKTDLTQTSDLSEEFNQLRCKVDLVPRQINNQLKWLELVQAARKANTNFGHKYHY